jgi:hypothetical protein
MRATIKSFLILLLGLIFLSLASHQVQAQGSQMGGPVDNEEERPFDVVDASNPGPTLEANMDPGNSIKITLTPNKSVAKPGEEITITATTDRDCYLTVFSFSDTGKAKVLWPLEGEDWAGKVRANTPVEIPPLTKGLKIVPDGSSPLEHIVAVAADRKEAIFTDRDFQQAKGATVKSSMSDSDDLVDEFSERITKLDPSVKWGTAKMVVRIARPGHPVPAPPAEDQLKEGRVKVTLHIFSGRPDPSWFLSKDQATALVEKLRTSATQTLKAMPEFFEDVGYRGFSIEGLPDAELKGAVTLYDNVIDINGLTAKSLSLPPGNLEQWLLETAGNAVDPELQHSTKGEILKPRPKGPPAGSELDADEQLAPKRFVRNENPPPYEPHKWNRQGVKGKNNCYNYSTNRVTNSFAQVGRRCGREVTKITCANVIRGAECDGLIYMGRVPKGDDLLDDLEPKQAYGWGPYGGWPYYQGYYPGSSGSGSSGSGSYGSRPSGSRPSSSRPSSSGPSSSVPSGSGRFRSGGHIVAVIVSPGKDYHWYRLDDTGRWSHKSGGNTARDYDCNGRKMFKDRKTEDLRRASLPYRDFCGYFYVPPGFRAK